MSTLYIIREKQKAENRFNAGSKAREDVDAVLRDMGGEVLECTFTAAGKRIKANPLQKLLYHRETANEWNNQLRAIPSGNTAVFQFPVLAHTILFSSTLRQLKKRNIKTIAVLHDLDILRYAKQYRKARGFRMRLEETKALKAFDRIIVHNARMQQILADRLGIQNGKMVPLGIFDYLFPEDTVLVRKGTAEETEQAEAAPSQGCPAVIIAGNLAKEKSGYVYCLPKGISFALYGANYEGEETENIRYKGKYHPDILPAKLQGDYGLVWDGGSAETCAGVFGEYLKVNNPHKASLYLACGIPVIVWEEAAIAEFIKENKCGITVRGLQQLPEVLRQITNEEYGQMQHSAEAIGRKLRDGAFMKQAIKRCLE